MAEKKRKRHGPDQIVRRCWWALPTLLLIDSWRSDPRVDRRRVYVTGVSMGGNGTWHLVAAKPEWFAAAVLICGGSDPSSASKLITVPIWAVHGSEDKVVPPEQSRTMINAIRAVGGNPSYTELPGVGHDSWSQSYRVQDGVIRWIYRHVDIRDYDMSYSRHLISCHDLGRLTPYSFTSAVRSHVDCGAITDVGSARIRF